MKEEQKLNEKFGKHNPFKVPEYYFDSFVSDIMGKLPEKDKEEREEIGIWERVKPWVYMVAMFCGLMFSLRVIVGDNYKSEKDSSIDTPSLFISDDAQDEYINAILDEVMIDDYTLYLYLTDSETEIYGL